MFKATTRLHADTGRDIFNFSSQAQLHSASCSSPTPSLTFLLCFGTHNGRLFPALRTLDTMTAQLPQTRQSAANQYTIENDLWHVSIPGENGPPTLHITSTAVTYFYETVQTIRNWHSSINCIRVILGTHANIRLSSSIARCC